MILGSFEVFYAVTMRDQIILRDNICIQHCAPLVDDNFNDEGIIRIWT